MSPAPFLVTLLDRVKAIVRRVVRPAVAGVRPVDGGAAVRAVAQGAAGSVSAGSAERWMAVRLRALAVLMRQIEAGTFSQSPVGVSGAVAGPGVAGAAPVSGPGAWREARRFGWMCGLGPNVRRDGQAFVALLNETWMQAMVLAAPREMARAILPILHAVGERAPAWFPEVSACADTLASGGDEPVLALDGAGCFRDVVNADLRFRRIFPEPAASSFAPPLALPTRGGGSLCDRVALTRHAVSLRGDVEWNDVLSRDESGDRRGGPPPAISKTSEMGAGFSYVLIVTISKRNGICRERHGPGWSCRLVRMTPSGRGLRGASLESA